VLRTDRIPSEQLERLAAIVDRLTATGDVAAASLMIVGARCRDLLHAAYGHAVQLRATNDFDVAIATPDLGAYERLTSKLTSVAGTNGVCFRLDGYAVDLVPFGDVEDPAGTVRPGRRSDGLNVWGFREVYDAAMPLSLGGGHTMRLPNAAGFIALKMAAWIDRSEHRDFRDAADLAVGCYWYAEDEDVRERLHGTEHGQTSWSVSTSMWKRHRPTFSVATVFLLWERTTRHPWASDGESRRPTSLSSTSGTRRNQFSTQTSSDAGRSSKHSILGCGR
jgi:predicted nucleotidyltransferase